MGMSTVLALLIIVYFIVNMIFIVSSKLRGGINPKIHILFGSRASAITSMALIAISGIMIFWNKDKANIYAIYAFYLLIVSVILMFVEYLHEIRKGKQDDTNGD